MNSRLLYDFLLLSLLSCSTKAAVEPKAYLVETIPQQTTGLLPLEGVETTAETLIRLVKGTQESLDFTAMYWALTTQVTPPCKPDEYCPDDAGFTRDQFNYFGAQKGQELYEAISDAAARGVKIRIIEAPGFDPHGNPESGALAKNFTNVELRQIVMEDWYAGGIMHQKIWIFDNKHGYIGSANQDWKSLAQVKELGIAFENAADVVKVLEDHFNVWWSFVDLDSHQGGAVAAVFDKTYRISRQVPCWSELNPDPCFNPLQDVMPNDTQANAEAPKFVQLNGNEGSFFMSCSPPETCITNRTKDEDSLVHTIFSAKKQVSISVMDYVPSTLYSDVPIFWNVLNDAILKIINSVPGMHVRLLVSNWAHTSPLMMSYLRSLQQMSKVCASDEVSHLSCRDEMLILC
mmetsp:Transcript_6000/g.9337  ORF Transcript_6000/g.9337 Transcript_6000/m.9337 type:complete len:404 (-) Transcript_6000:115-1326(-)